MTFSDINDATGFANGDMFETADQVRDYFRVEILQECLWQASSADLAALPSQEQLNAWADLVIEKGWHMSPCRMPGA